MVYPYNGIVGNSEKERGSNMCSKKKKKSQKYNKGKRQVAICIISTILVLK